MLHLLHILLDRNAGIEVAFISRSTKREVMLLQRVTITTKVSAKAYHGVRSTSASIALIQGRIKE